MQVILGQELTRSLKEFEQALHRWTADGRANLLKSFQQIGQRWRTETVKRVPVDTSRLKQQILSNAYDDRGELIVEVGTNVTSDKGAPYPVYLEFGTRYIAGGRVKSLGMDPEITDAEAITLWPAKVLGTGKIGKGGFRKGARISTTTGLANERVVQAVEARIARGGRDEQMPFIRPAFWAIREWALSKLDDAMEPPEQGRRAA